MATQLDGPNGKIERIKAILIEPKTEWPRIEGEPTTTSALFSNWAVPLAAIGPVAGFLGLLIVGASIRFALPFALVSYGLALLGVWVMAKIIDVLAPTFGATPNPVQAMKVAVFSSIPGWLAGAFQIVPGLGVLAIVGLYGLYLLYIGLPLLMKPAADKAVSYFAAVLVAALIVFVVAGALTSRIVAGLIF